MTLVEDLRHRQVGFKVLTGQGPQVDTTTANGLLVFGIIAALAEFEVELIRERTRNKTPTTLRIVMAALADRRTTATDVAAKSSARTMLALPGRRRVCQSRRATS